MESLWLRIPAGLVALALLGQWVRLRVGPTPQARAWAGADHSRIRFSMLVLPTLGCLAGLVAVLASVGDDATTGGSLLRGSLSLVVLVLLVGFVVHGLLGALIRPVPVWLMPRWARKHYRERRQRENQTRARRRTGV